MLFPVIDFVRPEPVRFETNAFLFIPLFVVFYQASIASRWTITLQKRLSPLASALWQSPRGRSSGKTRHGSRDTVARITSIRFSRSPIRSRSIIRGDRIIVDGTLTWTFRVIVQRTSRSVSLCLCLSWLRATDFPMCQALNIRS